MSISIVALANTAEEGEEFRRSYQKVFGDSASVTLLIHVRGGGPRKLRIVEFANYLKSPACPIQNDQDIVIYIDPAGLLMTGWGSGTALDQAAIREYLERDKKSIIFGAAPFAHGLYPESVAFFESVYSKEVFKYPASGFAIGYKWALAQLYGNMAGKISYYPKSPDGMEVGESHIVGNTYYQMMSPKFELSNKPLQHIKVGLDHTQRFFFQKGPKMPLYEVIRVNSPFLLFFGSHGGVGMAVIHHQRLDYACVVKLMGIQSGSSS